MQATTSQPNARANMRGRGGPRPSFKGIGRAVRYLTHYGRQAVLPYVFLIIATLSQLAVPHMVRNVIDAVTSGYLADQILGALGAYLVQAVPPQKADAALVLAGDGWGNRILTAAQLARDGFFPKVLVSGPDGAYGNNECDLAIPFAVKVRA